jgi:hypothetical protein
VKDVSETVRAMIGPTVLSSKDGHQIAYNGRNDLFWVVLPDGAFRCLAEFEVREFVDSIRDQGLISSNGGNERLAIRIFANDPNPFTNTWKARYGHRPRSDCQ